jgi:hypothetical protein
MPRVLLLATTTGYQTRAFGDAAAQLGVDLTFATDRCHMIDDPWRDQAIPIRFHDEEAAVEAILVSARQRRIDGVMVVGDRPTVIAARAAEALGLPGSSPRAAAIARNKQQTREHLRSAGLLTPWFIRTTKDADPRALASTLPYPVVVKPVALSGSRGVMRADEREAFMAAFARLRALLQAPDILAERSDAHEWVLIEGFIPGREYAVEGLLSHGTLQLLAIFDKPEPLDGPFFEETIYVTPSRAAADAQDAIVDAVRRAAAAIGLSHGPIHAECRVNDRGVFVLEVAARPIGGLCSRALRFHEPDSQRVFSLEALLLLHALGETTARWRREPDASGVMMIPIPRRGVFRGARGLDAARAIAGVHDVRITAKPDQLLLPLPEGASYLGFIFAGGRSTADVERALRDAHGCLDFAIESEIPVVSGGRSRPPQLERA